MVIKIEKIMDYLFFLFIFSMIVLPNSLLGKVIQLLFIAFTFFFLGRRNTKFTKYSFLEFLFLGYTLMQYFLNITVIKDSSLSMSITILYNCIFSLAMISYLMYKNDFVKFSELYAKSTLFSMIILVLLYNHSFFSGRFEATKTINFLGTNSSTTLIGSIASLFVMGGHSSTSLSMIVAIPCFFLNLFGEKKKSVINFVWTLILFIISLATGTRKTLLIFAVIFFVILPLKNKKISIIRLLVILFGTVGAMLVSLFLCLNVPILYETVGYRIEGVIESINVETDSIEDDSLRVRKRMIAQSKILIKQKMVYGWGMDYFRASKQNNLGYYSHNNFFELLIGGGVVGFLIYYLKYFYLFIMSLKLYFKDKDNRYLWFSCLGILLTVTILEYWQVTYIYRFIIIYQSIICAMIYLKKNELETLEAVK